MSDLEDSKGRCLQCGHSFNSHEIKVDAETAITGMGWIDCPAPGCECHIAVQILARE